MIFTDAECDENFPIRRLTSLPDGRWEVGLVPMAFGVRVRLGIVGNGWCTLDYCAGANRDWQSLLLGVVMGNLNQFDESVTEIELCNYFPRQRIKPMSLDKECWLRLIHDWPPEVPGKIP